MRRSRGKTGQTAKVFEVSVDGPLRPLEVDPDRYRETLLVVRRRGAVIGEIWLPFTGVVTAELQRAAISHELGEGLWRLGLAEIFEWAARGETRIRQAGRTPAVSVIVCTRDRTDQLRPCLESLLALRTRPDEILVVDNCPTDDSTRKLCADLRVRYLREELPGQARARNRGIIEAGGDLIAFTDDDCVVDPGWLDDLGSAFADPMVMAVTGYIAPLELETSAQYLFERHGGFEKHFEQRIYDGTKSSPAVAAGPAGAGANSIFRRTGLEEIGLFAEDLGPGTPARSGDDRYAYFLILEAGYRIVFDPGRVVWHRHRRDLAGLRGILRDYTLSSTAFASRCLIRHREPSAVRIWSWWWFHHLRRDLVRLLRRDDRAIPLRVFASELAGTFVGPFGLLRSRWSRRGIPPVRSRPESPSPSVPAPLGLAVRADDPLLSVAITSHNRRAKLREVLEALARQTYPFDRFEVVLVLDGGSDGSAEMAGSLDLPYDCQVFEQQQAGAGAGRNRCGREALHPVVVWLDDDVVPDPAFLAEHAQAHRDAREEQFVLGYYPPVVEEQSLWALSVRAWWEDHFRRKAEPGHQWTYVDFVSGNVSVPRSLFLDSGGFDESFVGRREDWEYGIRLLRGGIRLVYEPLAIGRHFPDTSLDTALRNCRKEGAGDVLLATRHPDVKGHLPLAFSPYARREPHRHALAAARPVLDVFEAMRLRRRWRRLAGKLFREAYAIGLADAMSRADFRDFVAPLERQSAVVLPVALDGRNPVRVPPGAGPIELELRHGGHELGRVRAVEPQGQWDWRAITERVVWSLAERDEARAALPLEDVLDRLLERTAQQPVETQAR